MRGEGMRRTHTLSTVTNWRSHEGVDKSTLHRLISSLEDALEEKIGLFDFVPILISAPIHCRLRFQTAGRTKRRDSSGSAQIYPTHISS